MSSWKSYIFSPNNSLQRTHLKSLQVGVPVEQKSLLWPLIE
jgi:hypothetical protein